MTTEGLTIDSFPTMETFNPNAIIYVVSNETDMKITAGDLKELLIENLPPPPMPEGVVSEQNFNSILEADQTFQQVEQKLTEVYHERLTANRIYYVRKDGSDTNAGLINDASGAFLTIQHAINVASQIDFNENKNFSVTIQVASGIYNEILYLNSLIKTEIFVESNLPIRIIGNLNNPETVVIQPINKSYGIYSLGNGSRYSIEGLTIDLTSAYSYSSAVLCAYEATLRLDSIKLILKPTTTGFWVFRKSLLVFAYSGGHGLTVVGNSSNLFTVNQAMADFEPSFLTLIDSPVFSDYAVGLDDAGIFYCYIGSVIGAAVGKRFNIKNASLIQTWGSGLNHIPGTIAGTISANSNYE